MAEQELAAGRALVSEATEDELLARMASGAAVGEENLTASTTSTADLGDSLRHIDALLMQLQEEEQEVLRRLFGLDGTAPASPRQLAETLQITVEQVHDLHMRALSRLRSVSMAGVSLGDN